MGRWWFAGVSTYTNGMSAIGIWAGPTASDHDRFAVISGCTVTYASSGLNIVRRDDMIAAIHVDASAR